MALARKFKSVMCLGRRSGSFSANTTWLGGVAPTTDFCGSVGGCDLYLPSGLTITTEALSGELSIQLQCHHN